MAGLDLDPTGISGLAGAAAKIISLFKEDPTVKAQLSQQIELTELQGQIQEVLAQIQVDSVEAANKSVFVAGWRPWVGWVGGTALGTPFLVYLIKGLVIVARGAFNGHFDTLPEPDTTVLLTALGSILGLGTMRTIEKTQGASAPGNIGH